MNDKKQEKRSLKGYKVRESVYRKAQKRANKHGVPLATKIERWVTMYADGFSVEVKDFTDTLPS